VGRDIRISAEAAAAVGPARARAFVAGPDPGPYTCTVCGQPGDADAEPTSIVVHRHPAGIMSVVCAHAGCCPSRVEDRGDFDASQLTQVRVIPVLLAGTDGGDWAVLVVRPRVPVELAEPALPDRTSAHVSGWLRDGLSLMGAVPELPPPPAEGWRAVLLATGGPDTMVWVTVLCPGSAGEPEAVADDVPILPGRDWLAAARIRGEVAVYAGLLTGLRPAARRTADEIARALADAAGKGLLVGGRAEAVVIGLQ
jgi:hypothetical protein